MILFTFSCFYDVWQSGQERVVDCDDRLCALCVMGLKRKKKDNDDVEKHGSVC